MDNKNGQSVLEYVVVFVAITAVVLVAAPMFLRPSVNRYYEGSGVLINSASNGLETLASNMPDRFTRNWSDYAIDPSQSMSFDHPSYEEMTAGWADLQQQAGTAVPPTGSYGGGGGYSGCGGAGQPACP